MMLEFLGASPVGMPPGQVYENMQRGVLDGAAFAWDPVRAFKLGEVSGFHFEASLYTAFAWCAINERRYQSLPADIRRVIDQTSGAALLAGVQQWWDAWDAAGKATAVARGNTIVSLDRAQRESWRRTPVPMFNKAMVDFEKQGIANANPYNGCWPALGTGGRRVPGRGLLVCGQRRAAGARQRRAFPDARLADGALLDPHPHRMCIGGGGIAARCAPSSLPQRMNACSNATRTTRP